MTFRVFDPIGFWTTIGIMLTPGILILGWSLYSYRRSLRRWRAEDAPAAKPGA